MLTAVWRRGAAATTRAADYAALPTRRVVRIAGATPAASRRRSIIDEAVLHVVVIDVRTRVELIFVVVSHSGGRSSRIIA